MRALPVLLSMKLTNILLPLYESDDFVVLLLRPRDVRPAFVPVSARFSDL
jgi:hypothetical protein